MRESYNIIFFILFIIAMSCEENIEKSLKIIVVDQSENPIQNASIFLDDVLFGQTNVSGYYSQNIVTQKDQEYKISVSKKPDEKYYSTFNIKMTFNDIKPDLLVNAKLYSVKKLVNNEDVSSAMTKDSHENLTQYPKNENVKNSQNHRIQIKNDLVDDKLKKNHESSLEVLVMSDQKAISNAEVYMGLENEGVLFPACKTNMVGYCKLKIQNDLKERLVLFTRKLGYLTSKDYVNHNLNTKAKIHLQKGDAINVFALLKSYNRSRGAKGVEVYMDHQKIGETDSFGYLGVESKLPKHKLVKFSLRSKKYIPKLYSEEISMSSNMTMRRYLSLAQPHRPQIGIANIKYFNIDPNIDGFSKYDSMIYIETIKLINQSMYAQAHKFTEYKPLLKNIVQLHPDSELHQKYVDIIADISFFKFKDRYLLEILLNDLSGHTIIAAIDQMKQLSEQNIKFLLKSLIAELANAFPYEGAVVRNNHSSLKTNLPQSLFSKGASEHYITIYGKNRSGRKDILMEQSSALGKIFSKNEFGSLSKIISTKSDSFISEGDKVVINYYSNLWSKPNKDNRSWIMIKGEQNNKFSNLSDVNVYQNFKWIGKTNNLGKIYIEKTFTKNDHTSLLFIKRGYDIHKIDHINQVYLPVILSLKKLNKKKNIQEKYIKNRYGQALDMN